MFERFTDRARRVVVLAQEEARLLNHTYIGTEHLLLGLIREGGGVAAMALDAMGVAIEQIRRDVHDAVGEGEAAPTGHIPFTPQAKKVLELALREALQLGHNYIGTEHILLGLVREDEGVAAQVLQRRGAGFDRIRQTVIQLTAGSIRGSVAVTGSGMSEEEETVERMSRELPTQHEEPPPKGTPICPNCRVSLVENARVKRLELDVEGEPTMVNIAYCHRCGITLGIKVV